MTTTLGGKLLLSICERLRAFSRCRRGNVAMIFALAIIPIVGAVGAAVDYSRANSVKAAMQAALDATALMLSKEAAGMSNAQLAARANTEFTVQFHRKEARNVRVTPVFTSNDGGFVLTLSGSATVDADFVRLFGIPQLRVTSVAQVTWGTRRLELALVLDNTGSMGELNKIEELRTASHNMLRSLQQNAKRPGDIKVSIVPFGTQVNIGKSNRNKPWIDWSTLNVSMASLGPAQNAWSGCIIDRDQPFDVDHSAPTRNSATFYPAVNCDLAPIVPLTTNWKDLHDEVTDMHASGLTNLTIGLVWGWNMLTQNVPLSNAGAPARDLDKVIVLLTDGLNTRNRWTGSASEIDKRTRAVCDALRRDKIQVFTVRVIEGNVPLLKGCATDPSMYYEVKQAKELNGVFVKIMEKLSNLYISR